MNYTRAELKEYSAVMNQMRNTVNHLIRFMKKSGAKDIKDRLRRMGKNIGRTYSRYWKPTDFVTLDNVRDVIATLYKEIVNSSINVEINKNQNKIIVKDSKCSMCKYQFDDIDTAGCEVLIGMVSEFVQMINKDKMSPRTLSLEPEIVLESKALGHDSCVQVFKYKIGGN